VKNLKKQPLLTGAVLVLGIAAGLLRRGLYAAALDEKGLLTPNHPLAIALWAVAAAGSLLILWAAGKPEGSLVREASFRPSSLSFLGHCFLACTVLMMTLLDSFPLSGHVHTLWRVLGFLSGPALVWAGICRLKGKTPFFGIYGALCLFLLLYLVSCYQLWSSNPQLQDYVFELLALVALILFCYHRAAFAAGMGKQRQLLITGLLAVLLCGAANYRAHIPALYAGGLFWAAAELWYPGLPPVKDEVDTHDPA